MAIITAGNEPD